MNKWPFLCLVSLALGAGMGWGVRGANGFEPSAAARPDDRSFDVEPTIVSSAMSAADQTRVGMIVRSECGLALKRELAELQSNRNVAGATTAATKKPATSQQLEQRSTALAEIDALLNGGEISAEDRGRFHADLAALDPQQRAEALDRFGMAANSGRIKLLRTSWEP